MHSMKEESNLWQKVYEESPTSNGCAAKVFVAAVITLFAYNFSFAIFTFVAGVLLL